jgi:small-conductance mechanosensitive channel
MTTLRTAIPELDDLLDHLFLPASLTEAGIVLAALVMAWGLVRLVRGAAASPGSIWFGRRIYDGVLFPLLALALVVAARHLLSRAGMPLAVFKVALPVLLSLAVIRLAVRVLGVAFPTSSLMRAAERTISWLAWLAVVLWITGLLPAALDGLDDIHWKVGNSVLSVRNMIEGALSAGLVLVVVLWISSAIEAALLKGVHGEQLSLRKAAANTVRALLLFVGLLLALSAVGIDLTALSVLGGALGVGIGFGLQKLAANYVSGFVILAERSLRIGDMVKVDGFEGTITDIKTRYTVIRALNGRESIVPNEMLISQRVENSSLADPRVVVVTGVQVAYGTDLEMLLPQLTDAVAGVPRVLNDPGPAAQLKAFGADGLDLQIAFWIADPQFGDGNVRSDVNLAVLRLLNRLGVEIPFPQRVLQLTTGSLPAPLSPPSTQ